MAGELDMMDARGHAPTLPRSSQDRSSDVIQSIAVLLVATDDRRRDDFRAALLSRGFRVYGPTEPSRIELALREASQADAAVVDIDAGEAAYDLVWRLNAADTPCRSVVLGTCIDRATLRDAFLASVVACLVKPVQVSVLEQAVRRAADSTGLMRSCISRFGTTQSAREPSAAEPAVPSLTPRERQILEMVLEGQSTHAIAKVLGVRARTVKFHVSNLLHKLGATSRISLLAKASPGLARFTRSAPSTTATE